MSVIRPSPMLNGAIEDRRRREIVTPEGVRLMLVIAGAGDRLCALLIDLVIAVGGAGIFATVVISSAIRRPGGDWLIAVTLLLTFVVTNFYFTWAEFTWQGLTLGKRIMRIRVSDAHGRALTGDAVIARNLTRNFELLLPLHVLLYRDYLMPAASHWALFFSSLWILAFGLWPLLNRDRRRVGDLIGGTLVVEAPRAVLLKDIGVEATSSRSRRGPSYEFTTEQLELYGIYELQVLEDVLRRGYDLDEGTLAEIAERIKRKIGWDPAQWDVPSRRFLADFYTALRSRLETKMLFGRRQEHKVEGVLRQQSNAETAAQTIEPDSGGRDVAAPQIESGETAVPPSAEGT